MENGKGINKMVRENGREDRYKKDGERRKSR
jgi:hypothetical protein